MLSHLLWPWRCGQGHNFFWLFLFTLNCGCVYYGVILWSPIAHYFSPVEVQPCLASIFVALLAIFLSIQLQGNPHISKNGFLQLTVGSDAANIKVTTFISLLAANVLHLCASRKPCHDRWRPRLDQRDLLCFPQ